jgi:hypothetical protein
VARYKPSEEREEEVAPIPQMDFQTVDGDPFAQPIRPGLRFVRTGAGVVGLGVGAWLFGAGQDLDYGPAQVLFLIGYGCISLFWILSAPIRVPVKQFAIEMLIFIIATLLLRLALPAAFDLGRLSNNESAPLSAGLNGPDFVQDVTPAAFANEADNLCKLTRALLDESENGEVTVAWKSAHKKFRKIFRNLSAEERKDAELVYKGSILLESRIKAVTSNESSVTNFQGAFEALESLEREIINFAP